MSLRGSLKFFLLLFSVNTLVGFARAQSVSASIRPEDQVVQLERDWLAADAKGDASRLRTIIADDFLGSSFNGSLLNKEDIIPEDSVPGGFAGATPGESRVRIFGDTGVLIGVIDTAQKGPAKQLHVMMVCQKGQQVWQIISVQLTHAR